VDYTTKQLEIIRYENRERPLITICEGAVRSGKTVVDIDLFNILIAEQRNLRHDFIISGHTIGSIERNVFTEWEKRWGIRIKLDQHNRFDLYGNKVNCFGADKSDSYQHMTGMTGYGWYANEVTLQHRNTIIEAFNRCSGEGTRILWDTNPDYPEHFVKTDYIAKSGERLSSNRIRIKSWHFQLEDNTFLGPEYIENIKATTPLGMWYNRRIKGEWVAAEGIVYEGWDPDVHVIDPFEIPASWSRVFGIDWGFVNPFVLLLGALDPDGRLYIYDEYYKTNTLIKDHAKEFYKRASYKDKQDRIQKRKYLWGVADHDAQDNAELRAFGIQTKPAQKDVLTGIQKVAERLIVRLDGKPRIMIFRTCPNLRRETGNYRWLEQKDGKPMKEEPLKVDDHGPDTLRYMIMQLDHEKPHGIHV